MKKQLCSACGTGTGRANVDDRCDNQDQLKHEEDVGKITQRSRAKRRSRGGWRDLAALMVLILNLKTKLRRHLPGIPLYFSTSVPRRKVFGEKEKETKKKYSPSMNMQWEVSVLRVEVKINGCRLRSFSISTSRSLVTFVYVACRRTRSSWSGEGSSSFRHARYGGRATELIHQNLFILLLVGTWVCFSMLSQSLPVVNECSCS